MTIYYLQVRIFINATNSLNPLGANMLEGLAVVILKDEDLAGSPYDKIRRSLEYWSSME